ncbi:MAG: P27 family phage terminase small subunit [Clostridia bacterium]
MAGRPRVPVDGASERSGRRNRGLKNPAALEITSPVQPPEWLDTDAGRKCFHDLQVPLIQAGILQTLDIPNLALMAQFWSDYIEARAIIRAASQTAAGYVQAKGRDDLFSCMMESLKQYQALLAKFAGSPIDRTKIVVREKKPKSGVAGLAGGTK